MRTSSQRQGQYHSATLAPIPKASRMAVEIGLVSGPAQKAPEKGCMAQLHQRAESQVMRSLTANDLSTRIIRHSRLSKTS